MVVQPCETKDTLLMDNEKKFNLYGKVLAVGKDVKEIMVGDYIGFAKWGLSHLDINGTRHYFVPEKENIGLVIVPASWII